MDNQLLDLLIESFDRDLNPDEKKNLNQALATNAELRAEKDRLLKMRIIFSSSKIGKDEGFVDRVMNMLDQEKQLIDNFSSRIVTLFPRVAAACIILITALLVSVYMTQGSISLDTLMGLNDLSFDDAVYSDYIDFE